MISEHLNKMATICLVIPSLQSGGMERVMSELIQNISIKKDVEIHLVLYGKSRDIFYKIPDSIRLYKPDWQFNDNYRFINTIRTLAWVRRALKEIDPDTVLSFGEYWNSFILLAVKGTSYPVYVSDRCKPDKDLGKLHETLRKWLYPAAAGIVAQTETARDVYHQKKLNHNIRVIGNPIREITSDGEPQKKDNIVLTVGRLIKTKHHDRLISIFERINKAGWKLVIVGGDAIKQDGMSRLKKLIDEKGLQERVILTGTVPNVERYYLKSVIFAFTSSSEGFPNAIGEAMAAGLPVVSYDCMAGPSDMIEDGRNGYLVDLFDDETFKERLELLMVNEDLRQSMGEVSKELIKRYSATRISEQYYSFITESI